MIKIGKNKKKILKLTTLGFTLIELLAVIVILAVIALITIPIIGNIIEDSKKKALEQSVYGVVEAARYFTLSHDGVYEFIFDENKNGETETGEYLDYKGQLEAPGKLYIDDDGNISLCFMDETYYVYKNYNSGIYIGNVTDDTCIIGYDAITNKYVAMLDDGTGTVSNVYSKEEVDAKISEVSMSLSKYALQNDLETTNNNINDINTQVNQNTMDIESLQTELGTKATSADLEALSSVVSQNQADITTLQNSLSKYALQTSLDTTNTKITNLQSQISTVNTTAQNAYTMAYNVHKRAFNLGAEYDLNNLNTVGFYTAYNPINGPLSINGWCSITSTSFNNDPSYTQQIAFCAEAMNYMYYRYCNGGTWSQWMRSTFSTY